MSGAATEHLGVNLRGGGSQSSCPYTTAFMDWLDQNEDVLAISVAQAKESSGSPLRRQGSPLHHVPL